MLCLLPFAVLFAAFASEDDPCCVPKDPYICPHVMSMAFDGSGKRFVCANQRGELMLWEGAAEKPAIISLDTRTAKSVFDRGPQSIALDAEGRNAVLFYYDGRVKVWSLDERLRLFDLDSGFQHVRAGRCSPDGRLIACIASNPKAKEEAEKSTILFWNTADWKPAGRIETDVPINDICFDRDGRRLFGCGGYPTETRNGRFTGIVCWNIETKQETDRLDYGSGYPLRIAASPEGDWIAIGGGDSHRVAGGSAMTGHLRIFDWKKRAFVAEPYRLASDYVRVVEFTRDGRRLISGSYNLNGPAGGWQAELKCFVAPNWTKAEWTSTIGDASVHRMCVSPKSHAIIACEYNSMRVVDAEKGTVLGRKATFRFDGE